MPSEPTPAALPEDVLEIERQLAANAAATEEVLDDLSEEQLAWRPGPASWSIAQCLDHLAKGDRLYVDAMQPAVAAARRRGSRRRGLIRPGLPSRWFVRSLDAPPRRKFAAPAKIVPTLDKTGRQAADELRHEHARVQALLREAAELDLNRTRFINPFIPLLRFTLGTGFMVLAAHERRHLWQATRLRQHPGFP
jgi:hypothetical protein